MYELFDRRASGFLAVCAIAAACSGAVSHAQTALPSSSLVRKVVGSGDKLEITTNSSRILTLDKKIPRVQVNNPELLAVTPLSATQVQVSAKKAGVTQVNLWDDEGQIHTIDVYIYGDVRELEHALATQFPNSSIRVYRYSQSLVLTGFIDRPDYVDPIRQIAEDYAPKVINNIAVGGVQQVLLKVKVYEISRTKIRELGVDWAQVSSSGAFAGSSVAGLISNINRATDGAVSVIDTGGQTFEALFTNGADSFQLLIDALQEKNVAKILAEPNLVAVSGRPALFNEGGEIPILVPQSLGQIAIEYKPFGTQVDFLPIVLGNGKIRLEVRPRISDLDFANAVTIDDIQVPALTVRQVDTAVEMNAGQTFAIAGLIQQRIQTINRGIPFLADLPVVGVPFRRTEDAVEEVELLVLVTPELVDAMDPHEVPMCGPGSGTASPNDCDLFINGKVEVPDHCGPCKNCTCPQCVSGGFPGTPPNFVNDRHMTAMPHGVHGPQMHGPAMHGMHGPAMHGAVMMESPGETVTPVEVPAGESIRANAIPPLPNKAGAPVITPDGSPVSLPADGHFRASGPRPFVRDASEPYQPGAEGEGWSGGADLIGPVGYDAD